MMRKSRLLGAFMAVGLLGLGSPVLWAADAVASSQKAALDSPKASIETLDQALLQTMQAGKAAGYAGRYKIIAPVLAKVFDFDKIAQLALGSEWSKLSAAEQKQFVSVLAKYTAATYAGRFDEYDGERFAVVDTQELRPGTMGVFTTFTMKSGRVHRFDYLLEQSANKEWRVVNVVADGVSDLSLKRAEYTELLKSKGFPALLAHLRRQIQDYASGAKS
ncbi:ABC transporter substrate-binding protein [Candidatus Igneacidithiobacillus taiwanensis]|uniref:ABC transporter substrate-binding protein n=1 Tax=Candidatus Igneacidithiobacillus taiwanensis TaxID=1945924 RepID=UPI00289BAB74|nr:ABC transporter substrate-binding protein [Candidatus Igneacidithiobacillus taiwanensis]MCE5359488.1 ABC transporter substrate-binding protein [Acidithiobacillus sp.]